MAGVFSVANVGDQVFVALVTLTGKTRVVVTNTEGHHVRDWTLPELRQVVCPQPCIAASPQHVWLLANELLYCFRHNGAYMRAWEPWPARSRVCCLTASAQRVFAGNFHQDSVRCFLSDGSLRFSLDVPMPRSLAVAGEELIVLFQGNVAAYAVDDGTWLRQTVMQGAGFGTLACSGVLCVLECEGYVLCLMDPDARIRQRECVRKLVGAVLSGNTIFALDSAYSMLLRSSAAQKINFDVIARFNLD